MRQNNINKQPLHHAWKIARRTPGQETRQPQARHGQWVINKTAATPRLETRQSDARKLANRRRAMDNGYIN